MTVNSKLKQVISEVLNIPINDVKEDLAAGDVENWDSLGHLTVILGIEEAFNVKFQSEKIYELITVKKIQEELKIIGVIDD